MCNYIRKHLGIIFFLWWCFFQSNSSSVVLEKQYIVNTAKCKIPDYEPFNNETIGLWFPETYKTCSSKPLLTRIKKLNDEATLHIEQHLLPLYGKNVSCCAANILREKDDQFPDDLIRWSECETFSQKLRLKTNAVLVLCQDHSGYHVYKNTHYIITKNVVQSKMNTDSPSIRPLSVLFIVIDSVSRLNFIRTMPKSRNYLSDNGFIEMKGYNKIDDNTFPNFVALLTGLNKRQIREIHCTGKNTDELDHCPMIWYNFSSAGYVTAYGEDWGNLSTFNFYKKGFTKPPTDFYFRPYVLASEAIGTRSVKGAPFCAGPETSGERQLELALDFAKTFKNRPYFGIFWMNTFSHQSLNTPYRFDDKIREFFTNLKAEGILDDSLVILLSDHGMRIDRTIRRTVPGWFEERLPMNLISVPRWFREKCPNKFNNLKINSNKLTSTHDLYMTLQNVLSMSKPHLKIIPSRACPKCVSLFDQIPTRTCSQAGVPPEWCTCIGYLNHLNQSDPLVLEGIQFVLRHIKSEFDYYNYTQECYDFEILLVKKAALSETSEIDSIKYLFIHFITSPFAEFIATLKYDSKSKGQEEKLSLLLDVIRLDWGDNRCLPFNKLSQYCNCKRLTDTYSNTMSHLKDKDLNKN